MSSNVTLELVQMALAFVIALPCAGLALMGMMRRQRIQ
jgi:hypothetical protein